MGLSTGREIIIISLFSLQAHDEQVHQWQWYDYTNNDPNRHGGAPHDDLNNKDTKYWERKAIAGKPVQALFPYNTNNWDKKYFGKAQLKFARGTRIII